MDDSKIEDNDWMQRNDEHPVQAVPNFWWDFKDRYRKVTHSTKKLGSNVGSTYTPSNVKYLSLGDVKKVTGEVDMEELELKYHQQLIQRREVAKNFRGQVAGNHPDMFTSREMLSMMEGFTDGYTQSLDDNKDKKYTDDDVIAIVKKSRETGLSAEYIIISDYQPKSHWEVEFVDGKLKLK
ncbi:MAG: hypothetical protein K9I82_01750 [Chitinophagaceae bacterium]|nr:hypothetical protein [Chitinophagaceae bacterium]